MATSCSGIEGLITEVLTTAGESLRRRRRQLASETASAEVTSLGRRDYTSPLLRAFGRGEVREMLSEARRKVWPRLNREPVKLVSPREFTRHWSGLGVDFRVARWSWPKGLAVMGFYLEKTKGLAERPLICVNTAHHPAVVGVTFDHEMGHHLTSLVFGSRREPAHFLFYTGYARHLDNPIELAADILVSLCIYPGALARNIFVKCSGERGRCAEWGLAGVDLARVLDYMATSFGLHFDLKRSSDQMLQCLAALLHYTKLRRALLEQYDL